MRKLFIHLEYCRTEHVMMMSAYNLASGHGWMYDRQCHHPRILAGPVSSVV